MLKSHEKFHSANGKRQILVAEDEMINRLMLGNMLEEEYELIYAEDGITALELLKAYRGTLSLVLLDLIMPGMHGLDLLRTAKEDPELARIPIIVVTSDQASEVEALSLGAIDFISKPYPQAEVVRARVVRTIELVEDRDIIASTERDPLTGLYNRDYFYRYAEQYDRYHPDQVMDAIVVDVNHFHMINERYGKAYGDGVLRRVGEKVREIVRENGGIVCRRDADTFLVYCPHGEDYDAILENASIGLAGDDSASGSRVRLRMGVYVNVDKGLDVERRFDRAKVAADTVRSSFTRAIALYDNALHESEIYQERLLEDFQEAIERKQFRVYYQPKFDVRAKVPVLESSEALVRWIHPDLGTVSPGVFIPLFEENGMIQRLDHYVWEEAAAQVRDWRDRYGVTIPVSVNMSRVDMYDQNLIGRLEGILERHGLDASELHLEVTESAYTQDETQIIDTVNGLRERGFRIEMDDFGTGYSSLNMISTLPIDVLKLDMSFIRNAFSGQVDTRMIEIIIDIADFLGVPVIAEGVETEDQLAALRRLGCDFVQGFYFSRPVPAEEYDRFVEERKRREDAAGEDGFEMSEDFGIVRRRRDREFAAAQELTLRDEATGVKNDRAFGNAEEALDAEIAQGGELAFAIAVCNVNGLRDVNDALGREAGERYLRESCMTVCHTFEHSPVFRVADEEFVAILRGRDYIDRVSLQTALSMTEERNPVTGERVVSVGVSDFMPGTDASVSSVLVRADAAMHSRKRLQA